MVKENDKEVKEAKVKSTSKKPFNKKNIIWIACGVVGALIVGLIAVNMLKDSNNFVTMTDSLLSQQTGSFRYVFDIRTDEHSDSAFSDSNVEDIADLENIESDMDVDKILKDYENSKKEFSDWGNKSGIELTDWEYPKYKVVVEGNVKSVEPLEMSVKISLATNYFNDSLTDIVVKDNKTYINIEQLRYWLTNSKDENLVELGKSLPESSKYVTYEGDEFNLYSTFAEASEVDLSRDSDLVNLYKKFLITEKSLSQMITIDGSCFSEEGGVYKVNVTGDSSVNLLSSVKSFVLNLGSNYKSIIKNQYNNGTLTDKQYEQSLRETDNIVSAFSDLSLFLNTTDLSSLGLQMSGNAKQYTSGKGSSILESSLALKFTANNTDYNISIQLHKDSQSEDVTIPKQSSADISSFTDKDFVEKYLLEVFKYLNITGIDLEKQLEITPYSIKEYALADFVKLVNEVNRGKEGFTPITTGSIIRFIDYYRGYKVTDKTPALDKINSILVSDFLNEFNVLIPEVKETDDISASIKDDSRFPSLVSETDEFRVYSDFNKDTSNTRCIQLKLYILNKTGEELTINTSDFTLRTMQSSKYPANYQSLLKEYDNQFDMTKAPETLTISADGYIEAPLYFILSNGLEYMDLWYGETNLGVVVAR